MSEAPAPPTREPGVRIELESDAEQLFLESMKQVEPKSWDLWEEDEAPRKAEKRGSGGDGGVVEIDLHGKRLDEATLAVDLEIAAALTGRKGPVRFRIITGKGLHSGPGGSVLPREVHRHVKQRYADVITALDESPADVKVRGVPLRGHFEVTIAPKRR